MGGGNLQTAVGAREARGKDPCEVPIWRYHADRLMYPMRRVGAKGAGKFERITWEQALGTIAERLHGVAREWGPEAIRVEVATGAFRKLSGYALDLSRDGRFALVDSGGSEGPQEIAAVRIAGGHRRVLAHGDVASPTWNR